MVFKIRSNFDSVIAQIRFPISAEWIVNTFANFTIERFGSFPPTAPGETLSTFSGGLNTPFGKLDSNAHI